MSKSRLTYLICLLLAVMTFAAYWRALGCGFLEYDDEQYVTRNRWVQAGPTAESIRWALTSTHASNWHPLTWISHMLDCKVYGMNPLGHHLTNIILHVLSTILLFLLMRRMTGFVWRSAFVAALFALHPIHVESVAWVAERKDVLSVLFWMLTMHAYVSWTRRPGAGRYVLTLGLFVLGLMAKPMLVSLPIALLLIDYWPLGRFASAKSKPISTIWKLTLEKAPFFALAVASCVVTYLAQRHGTSVVTVENAPIGVRIANALVSYVAYLVKMVWPAKLALLYPHPLNTIPSWQVIGSALLLAAISVLAVRSARTRPYLAMGWFWYLITLVPVIGLVQVGMQAMADRYTYVPLLGVFMAVAYGVGSTSMSRSMSTEETPTLPHSHTPILCTLAVAIILACAAGTWRQVGYWKDSVSIFARTVAVTKNNFVTETNLGLALNKRGRFKEAIGHLQASIRIRPAAKPYSGIGSACVGLGRLAESVPYYEKSLDLDPESAPTHSNLGFVLIDLGRTDQAIKHFRRSIELDPQASSPAHCGLAVAYMQKSQPDAAVREYLEAVRVDPSNLQAYNELGSISLRQGKIDKAIEYFESALRIAPDPVVHYQLGSIFAHQQKLDEAMEHYRAAIELKPDYAVAHYDLAVALSAKSKFDEAIEHYSEAIRIVPGYAKAHMSFAIALYCKGDLVRARKEAGLARKYGAKVDPEFIKALSEKSK